MISIKISNTFKEERLYTLKVLFGDILGLEYEVIHVEELIDYEINLPNHKKIIVKDSFFTFERNYLSENELPKVVTEVSHELAKDDKLVVLFGENKIERIAEGVLVSIDMIAGSFFMLSRWEEIVIHDKDEHERFPASSSVAHKHSFLNRPIVDEYAYFLWNCIKKLCPTIAKKEKSGSVIPTCDVDYPYDPTLLDTKSFAKALVGDIVKRRSTDSFQNRIIRYIKHLKGDHSEDPNYTFDWFMDVCEINNVRAQFYFISEHSGGRIDGCYELNDKIIEDLLIKIDKRGHSIGLHGSYNTYNDLKQLEKEKEKLQKAVNALIINQEIESNRQHFLRWDTSCTPDYLENAGFKYDSTGAYADRSGFKYGTSHPFTMWSWKRRRPLEIIQKPLIMMEVSVIGKQYQGLGYSKEALDYMHDLKVKCLKYDGNFTFLWHNSFFNNDEDKEFFKSIITS